MESNTVQYSSLRILHNGIKYGTPVSESRKIAKSAITLTSLQWAPTQY